MEWLSKISITINNPNSEIVILMVKFGEKSRTILKSLFHVFSALLFKGPILFKSHSYLSRRTYPDTTVETVEACVGLTGFGHVQKLSLQLLKQSVNVSKLLKSPVQKQSTSYTNQTQVKHYVTRSLSEFWTIQIFLASL